MVVVRCQHCGAVYDTDLPIRAIERVRRCSRCGHAALVAVMAREPEGPPAELERRADDR